MNNESPKEIYEPEESSAPQNYILRCSRCRWARASSGLEADLKDLLSVKSNCSTCGKYRTYKCPKCGMNCPLKRVRGNS